MLRIISPHRASGWAVLLALALARTAPATGGLDEWKFEVLHLKTGGSLQGLVVEETREKIRFWQVKRPLGEPATKWLHVYKPNEVARIDRLSARDREALWARIKAIKPIRFKDELQLVQKLDLRPIPWGKGNARTGLSYTSAYFVLESDAGREIIGRAALRLEQIYAAYDRYLPSRLRLNQAARPTRIVLMRSVAEYQSLLRGKRLNIFNPAFYDSVHNEIVCASEFQRLGNALEQVRKQEEELNRQIAALKKRYKGRLPAVIRAQIQRDRKEIGRVNHENSKVFEAASRRLFQTLYHEAFHAYLDNFVYPAREVLVPTWLNEGLAQVFETAMIDAGELRIDLADRAHLERIRALVSGGDLVSVADLLKAGPRQFHVRHASEHQLADRYYMTSWALAFYLLVERKVLSNPEKLDQYVTALKGGANHLAAFRKLVGQPLPQFEKAFRDYLLRLQPEKSVVKKPKS
jgi:hypothetical protein